MYSQDKETDEAWQAEARTKIEELQILAEWARAELTPWELKFIDSMKMKLNLKTIELSPAQFESICNILEKTL